MCGCLCATCGWGCIQRKTMEPRHHRPWNRNGCRKEVVLMALRSQAFSLVLSQQPCEVHAITSIQQMREMAHKRAKILCRVHRAKKNAQSLGYISITFTITFSLKYYILILSNSSVSTGVCVCETSFSTNGLCFNKVLTHPLSQPRSFWVPTVYQVQFWSLKVLK